MPNAMNVDGRLTITITEASRLLGISRGSGYLAAREGSLPTLRLGRRLVVPLAGLERLLAGAGKSHPDDDDDDEK